MSNPPPDNGKLACDQIKDRLITLYPEMTFKVSPQNGQCAATVTLPGIIRIQGQRTKNLRYDRANFYASFDISGDNYNAADTASGADPLLQSAVADIDAQLRLRNQ